MATRASLTDRLRPWHVTALAAVIRAVLIWWAEYQDRHLPVKYTDIDYVVFTDAARFVANGLSPYQRSTYRYSPLLAYMVLPNIWLHPAWGKVLFSVADLAAAGLMSYLLRRTGSSVPLRTAALVLWLFNPYTATISTRGNCDVLSVMLLLCLLVCLLHGWPVLSGMVYGLAVHFRIYPVIYGPAIVLFLARRNLALSACSHPDREASDPNGDLGQNKVPGSAPAKEQGADGHLATATFLYASVQALPADSGLTAEMQCYAGQGAGGTDTAATHETAASHDRGGSNANRSAAGALAWRMTFALEPVLSFSVASAATFLLLGSWFFMLYGGEFLNEAFMHHLTRKDPRHNFSPYYYPVYLSYSNATREVAIDSARLPGSCGVGISVMFNASRGARAAATALVQAMRLRWQQYRAAAVNASVDPAGGGQDIGVVLWQPGQLSLVERLRRWLMFVRHAVPWNEPWRLAALPQAVGLLALALTFHEDLPAAWMLQTWLFVTLNKVVTAQYFVWYLSLLPLVLPALVAQRRVSRGSFAAAGAFWVAGQLHWLAWAYQLEMKGRSVHFGLWTAGLVFMAANIVLLVLLVRALLRRRSRPSKPSGRNPKVSSGTRDSSSGSGGAISPVSASDGGVSPGPQTFLEASLQLARRPARVASASAAKKDQ